MYMLISLAFFFAALESLAGDINRLFIERFFALGLEQVRFPN
jgi:hypothetical protein